MTAFKGVLEGEDRTDTIPRFAKCDDHANETAVCLIEGSVGIAKIYTSLHDKLMVEAFKRLVLNLHMSLQFFAKQLKTR